MPEKKDIGHVISHVHWDREWLTPIWRTRERLVDVLDYTLDLFDREPRFKGVLFDGQVVPMHDYLEMRPEQRDRLRAAVESGRLQIGPWFSLPDEFPVAGECLARNLLKGVRAADALGGAMRIGYTSFGWGQTAQMPQLLANFGIDFIVTGKRVNPPRAPHCEFMWEAPDGTRVLTTRLGEAARHNFTYFLLSPALFGGLHGSTRSDLDWTEGGIPFKSADPASGYLRFRRAMPVEGCKALDLEDCIERAWNSTSETVVPEHRFFGAGFDFMRPRPEVLEVIDAANQHMEGAEYRHSTLPEFVEGMQSAVDIESLEIVYGELRDGPANIATCNALATRPWLKTRNRKVQHRLIGRAEPWATMASALGAPYMRRFFDRAWDYLLKSHPHDSINGATPDKITRDTLYRLDQALELATVLEERAQSEILKRIDFGDAKPSDVFIVLFNPLPFERSEVIEVLADTPSVNRIHAPVLVDPDGTKREVQRLDRHDSTAVDFSVNCPSKPFRATRHRFVTETGPVPAGGYKVMKLICDRRERGGTVHEWPMPERAQGSLLRAPGVMENEYLRVSLNADGTFDLHDKERDRLYEGLHYFEDTGDRGDFWTYMRPPADRTIYSRGCPVRSWVETPGPLRCTLVVEVTMALPKGLDEAGRNRVEETRDVALRSEITLKRGARHVEIVTRFENTVEDHRLRVVFPSGIGEAMDSCAEGHFNVDVRPIAPREPLPSPGRYWENMQTFPMQTFVDLSDGERGLALLNENLLEYEVFDNPERTVALTLMRGMRAICGRIRDMDPAEKGSQVLGAHEYRYAVYPHAGDWQTGDVYTEARRFNLPVHPLECGAGEGDALGMSESLFALDPPMLQLCAVKMAEESDDAIVRLYNPTGDSVPGTLRCHAVIDRAERVRMDETEPEALALEDAHTLPLEVPAGRIVTVRVSMK